MVLAFETPFYVDGEGGFIIEDQLALQRPRRLCAVFGDEELVEPG